MPEVGLAHADHPPPPAGDAAGLLARMAPAHLRVDVHLLPAKLGSAGSTREARQAQALGCPLEVAVFLAEALPRTCASWTRR